MRDCWLAGHTGANQMRVRVVCREGDDQEWYFYSYIGTYVFYKAKIWQLIADDMLLHLLTLAILDSKPLQRHHTDEFLLLPVVR